MKEKKCQNSPTGLMQGEIQIIWEEMVPSGDVLIDRGIPAVSALSLFQDRSISDGKHVQFTTLCD